MRLTTWLALAIAPLGAIAQEMPSCASTCFDTYVADTSCQATDYDCLCADQKFLKTFGSCTIGACTVIEALEARNVTSTICHEPIRDRSLIAPIATAVTGAVALGFILVRVYDCIARSEFTWADLCAVLAMTSSIPMDVFEFMMMKSGMGKDVWTLTPAQITNSVKYTWVTQVFYIPAIVLTKVAILFFFMQIFPDRQFRVLCQVTMVHCFLFMVSTTVAAILSCVPVHAAWTQWTKSGEGQCYDNRSFWWAHSGINIATDLWILLMPIPMLLKLQLKTTKKVYLVLMFSAGIIITAMSGIRFSGLAVYSTRTNSTYKNVMFATYSVIECNVSIMCCCMPALLSCLRRSFPSFFNSSSMNYNKAPFPPNAIQMNVTRTITYTPRAAFDDVVELVDKIDEKPKTSNW
ncbi:hypothetical protein BJX76DRAFT_362799 [Aspergillus varians]